MITSSPGLGVASIAFCNHLFGTGRDHNIGHLDPRLLRYGCAQGGRASCRGVAGRASAGCGMCGINDVVGRRQVGFPCRERHNIAPPARIRAARSEICTISYMSIPSNLRAGWRSEASETF